MTLGPVQLIAIEFDSLDRLQGKIIEEIDDLIPLSAVRILDVLFVAKEDNGDLVSLEMGEMGDEAGDEALGTLIGQLMGFSFEDDLDEGQVPTGISDSSPIGLGPADIERIGDNLAPGTGAALLLVEHRWAAGVRDAVLEAGGRMVAQGFLTPTGLLLIGAELLATADAIDAIEMAAELEAEANVRALEALATIEIAAEVEAAVVARTILTLMEAGFIEQAATEHAARAVLDAAIIDQAIAAG
ncbi:MAG: hypothetical protein IH943_10145 [Acidobacteria bacterium]|nr:hypothetical protein [Acidobacteriota bacterium]